MADAAREKEIVVEGLIFGECPRWRDGRLYLSDMHGHRVLRVDADGACTTVARHDGRLAGLGWAADGALLCVAMDGAVLRWTPGGFVTHADLTSWAPYGVNDMVVDAAGIAYVGQFGYDYFAGEKSRPSPLLLVRPDGGVEIAAEDVWTANGMAISEDGGTLVVAESGGRRLTAFDRDPDGRLHGRRVFAELHEIPDGLCLDEEGAVWVACPVLGRFLRVRDGGEILDEIPTEDGRHAIACALGGPDRRDLHMITAETLGDAARSAELASGRLERVRVAVPGAGTP